MVTNRPAQRGPNRTSTSKYPGKDGQAHLQLREPGPGRALVLLDGSFIRTEQGGADDCLPGVTAGTGFADGRGQAFGIKDCREL
jgi:hypothetical protein